MMYKGRLDLLHPIHQYNRETMHDRSARAQKITPESLARVIKAYQVGAWQRLPGLSNDQASQAEKLREWRNEE
jgi:hypothetical protein